MRSPMRLLLLAFALASAASAQPVPDLSFADRGFALVKLPPSAFTRDVRLALDGTATLLLTTDEVYQSTPAASYLARLTPGGSADTLFAPAGIREVRPPAGASGLELYGLARLADGRIAAAGTMRSTTSARRAVVALLTPDGRPDSTFSGDGFAFVSGLSASTSFGYSVAETPGGLVVAGDFDTATADAYDGFVARVRLDGTPDPTFGTAGVTIVAGTDSDLPFDLAVFPDGRLLAVGVTQRRPVAQWDALFVRLTAAGQVETANGIARRDLFGDSQDYALRATALPDGRALVSGMTRKRVGTAESGGTTLFRLTADGAPDASFGFEGWTWTDAFPATAPNIGGEWPGRPFARPGGGAAVSTGDTRGGGGDGFAVVYVRADGSPDNAAATGGVARVFLDRPGLFAAVSADLQGGRLVVAGIETDPAPPRRPPRRRWPRCPSPQTPPPEPPASR